MKRKIWLATAFLITILVFVACKGNDAPQQGVGDVIYGSGIETTIITNMDLSDADVNSYINSVSDKIYSMC